MIRDAAAEAEKKTFGDRLKVAKEYSDVVKRGYLSAISTEFYDEIDG